MSSNIGPHSVSSNKQVGSPRADHSEAPLAINVVGRRLGLENADLVGEYHRIGVHHGRPAYRKPGTRVVIRYWSHADRWLIDREGLQESDICNAYSEQGGFAHPACEDIIWCVWETQQRCHVRDPEFLVTTAPATLQVCGRAEGKENASLNGEYRLMGLHQGRVAYQKQSTKHAIRYWANEDRWLFDFDGLREVDVCNAFADAVGSPHPAYTPLTWHVWDSERQRHLRDVNLQIINAPRVVEMVGRQAPKENTSMNGSYHIVGMHAGRPAYVKVDGSGHCIRYWPREDRWLVDLDGLRDSDICNAYAEVQDSSVGTAEHPGSPSLIWHIWETSRGRHLTDPCVRALIAPAAVRVMGRDPYKENAGVNGEYSLVSVLEGRPTYKKHDNDHVIRYWPSEDRWLIDLEAGFHGGDVANAFADARGAASPGNPDLIWYMWETARACHVADDDVICEPVWLPFNIPALQAIQQQMNSNKAGDQNVDYADRLDRHPTYYQGDLEPGPWKSGAG